VLRASAQGRPATLSACAGEEARLQRNALRVLQLPQGDELVCALPASSVQMAV
jgi:hypothetical protein